MITNLRVILLYNHDILMYFTFTLKKSPVCSLVLSFLYSVCPKEKMQGRLVINYPMRVDDHFHDLRCALNPVLRCCNFFRTIIGVWAKCSIGNEGIWILVLNFILSLSLPLLKGLEEIIDPIFPVRISQWYVLIEKQQKILCNFLKIFNLERKGNSSLIEDIVKDLL